MRKKWILFALIVFFAGIAVYSGIRIYRIYHGYHESDTVYEELAHYVSLPKPSAPDAARETQPSTKAPDASEPTTAPPERDFPVVDFAALQKINPELVGWIVCEGTQINYPVVRGQDNSYYLTHLFDGTYNSAGCIFLDYHCAADFSDTCSTVYGHHMKNGSMFSGITEYQTQAYYDAHPDMLLLTPTGNYVLELFSGYITDVHSDAWVRSFDTEAAYAQWLSDTAALSLFESSVVPTTHDRVITLSTCTSEFQNARFVLIGVLRPAE